MEGSTSIVLAIIVLAAGGAAGAAMMADGSLIGGSDGDASGLSQVEPLPYGDVDGSCSLGRAEGDCASGDCPVPDEDDQGSGDCCC